MKTLVIIPTYNEKENIEKLINEVLKFNVNVLVVDDNSPDGTGEIVKNMLRQNSAQRSGQNVNLIKRAQKLGLGSAYQAGFKWGIENNFDLFFQMDADFSHDPKDLQKMIQEIQNSAEVVIGSRRILGGKIIGWSWFRHFSSWGAMSFSRLILRLKTKDVTAGYRAFTKNALAKINWQNVKSNGYAFQEEIIYLCERAGLKIKEVPVVFVDRKVGKSKLGIKEIFNFFKTLFRLFFSK